MDVWNIVMCVTYYKEQNSLQLEISCYRLQTTNFSIVACLSIYFLSPILQKTMFSTIGCLKIQNFPHVEERKAFNNLVFENSNCSTSLSKKKSTNMNWPLTLNHAKREVENVKETYLISFSKQDLCKRSL